MFRNTRNPGENSTQTHPETNTARTTDTTYSDGESFARSLAAGGTSHHSVSESATIILEIQEGDLSMFIGSDATITGEIVFDAKLRVDGCFTGRISSAEGSLIVAAGGQVDTRAAVASAKIQGIVTGDVIASDRIELGRAAKMTGNVQAPKLIVEEGAVLDGQIIMTPQAAVTEPEVAELNVTAEPASAEKDIAAQKPRAERKANVLGAKGVKARAKFAERKTEEDETAADAATG